MVIVEYTDSFKKSIKKIKDVAFSNKIKNQIIKIINQPEIGKPMRYQRKGTRELYIDSYRLAYAYLERQNKIIFLGIYHKNKQ